MSPEITIVMLVVAWLTAAAAMLWGVMRIARRHHHSEVEHDTPEKNNAQPNHPASIH
jgi:hypothetical protein